MITCHFVCLTHKTQNWSNLCNEFPNVWHYDIMLTNMKLLQDCIICPSKLHYFIVNFALYSYCCPGLQCGYETGLSWGDGDLHLHCQPGSCSGMDSWTIHFGQHWYPVHEYWHYWEKFWLQWCCICTVRRLWLCGQPHKYCQSHCCNVYYSGWYNLHPDIHCCSQTEWDSGAVQRIDCNWILSSQKYFNVAGQSMLLHV